MIQIQLSGQFVWFAGYAANYNLKSLFNRRIKIRDFGALRGLHTDAAQTTSNQRVWLVDVLRRYQDSIKIKFSHFHASEIQSWQQSLLSRSNIVSETEFNLYWKSTRFYTRFRAIFITICETVWKIVPNYNHLK